MAGFGVGRRARGPVKRISWADGAVGRPVRVLLASAAGAATIVASMLGGAIPSVAGPTGTVRAWGYNPASENVVPASLTDVSAIAAGARHSLALKSDGSVVVWGNNGFHQTEVPVGLNETEVTAIAAGGVHSLALTAEGTVIAWGNNDYGQTDVPTGLTNVTAIAAGSYHSLALRADGTVAAWGLDIHGETDVEGLTDVKAIAAGAFGSLALKNDGTVIGLGQNEYGQTDYAKGLTDVVAIASGALHCLALTADGTVIAWGRDDHRQSQVPRGLPKVKGIAASNFNSYALTADGAVVAWGSDEYGQNGPLGLTGVEAIAAGGFHVLALVGGLSDVTPPAVQISHPVEGAAYLMDQQVTADYTCSDEGSGIASCVGEVEVGMPVDTSSVGAKQFTVTATDNAGNTTTETVNYKVEYSFTGFRSPIDPGTNRANAGRTIPFKFSVSDSSGNPVTDLVALKARVVSQSCDTATPTGSIEEYALGASGLQNFGNGDYQFNFATSKLWAGSCRSVGIDLGDGVSHTVTFQFTR